MKKLSIALIVFALAGAAFSSFKNAAQVWGGKEKVPRTELNEHVRTYKALAQKLRSLTEEHESLQTQISLAQQQIQALSKKSLGSVLQKTNFPPAIAEQLLSELGYNWNTTGDYLVVSKSSIPSFSLEAIRESKLTPSISELLAINPQEGAAVESLVQEISAQYAVWAKNHIQRHEPHENVLASYSLTSDPVLSQSLSNQFSNGLLSILGTERSAYFKDHSSEFARITGITSPGKSSFAITRPANLNGELLLEHQSSSGGSRICALNNHQEFPSEFTSAFPGGWPELAEREHFEMPKGFSKE